MEQGWKIMIFTEKLKSAPDMPPFRSSLQIALELLNKKSLEYQLPVWLCEQLHTSHFSGAKCIFSGAFAPERQTIFNPCGNFLLPRLNVEEENRCAKPCRRKLEHPENTYTETREQRMKHVVLQQ
jgi:hypothetical protein